MPRPRPPHLHRHKSRATVGSFGMSASDMGRASDYARSSGSPEFEAEYRAAISGQAVAKCGKRVAAVGSLLWLFDRYRETASWSGLSLATRRQRENIMHGVLAQAGHESAATIKRAHIATRRPGPSSWHSRASPQFSRRNARVCSGGRSMLVTLRPTPRG